jgi:hypothetical protein
MSEPNEPKRIPLWVNETPEPNYRIFMGDGDGSEVQEIDLTRDEYGQLKQRLAQMRGHITPETETSNSQPLTERIAKLREGELILIEAAVQACEHFSGSTSPAEEFLRDICREYHAGQLDPDSAEFALKIFRDNLQDMVKYTAEFARTNPREFKEICAKLSATETAK